MPPFEAMPAPEYPKPPQQTPAHDRSKKETEESPFSYVNRIERESREARKVTDVGLEIVAQRQFEKKEKEKRDLEETMTAIASAEALANRPEIEPAPVTQRSQDPVPPSSVDEMPESATQSGVRLTRDREMTIRAMGGMPVAGNAPETLRGRGTLSVEGAKYLPPHSVSRQEGVFDEKRDEQDRAA